jgi:hypothetical protein
MPKLERVRDTSILAQKTHDLAVVLKEGRSPKTNMPLDLEAVTALLEDAENLSHKYHLHVHESYLPMELGQVYIAKAKNGKIEAAKKNRIKFCGKKQNKTKGKVFKVETESVKIGDESVVLWKYGINSDFYLIQCRRKKGTSHTDDNDSNPSSPPPQSDNSPQVLVQHQLMIPDHTQNFVMPQLGDSLTNLQQSATSIANPPPMPSYSVSSMISPTSLPEWAKEEVPYFWETQPAAPALGDSAYIPQSQMQPPPQPDATNNNTHNYIQLPPLGPLKTSMRFNI